MAGTPPLPSPHPPNTYLSIDQFLNMELVDQSTANNTNGASGSSQGPNVVVHGPGEEGMSFAEMFREYLAPSSGKANASLPALPSPGLMSHPFSFDAPENTYSQPPFSPSAFMPSTIPGSPIGGYSPSSENSGPSTGSRSGNRKFTSLSPIDLDMDSELGSQRSWNVDPSFYDGTISNGMSTVSSGNSPQDQMVLPPLPELKLPQQSTLLEERRIKQEEVSHVLPPEPLVEVPTVSHKHGRTRSSSIVEEEEEREEEDQMDLNSDLGSDADSDEAPPSRRSSTTSSLVKSKRVQKLAKTSVAGFATATLHATSSRSTLPPVPEWTDKPDAEDYKKLNSKEKRQLRNKISARNFRHRRKEYITTLEEEISSRDTIISQLRDEVVIMKGDNKSLASEVALLKTKWNDMLEKMTSHNVPIASSSSIPITRTPSALGLGLATKTLKIVTPTEEEWALDTPKIVLESVGRKGTRAGTSAAASIAKPNTKKDSTPGSLSGNWAGANPGGPAGYMPVHTTLMPDLSLNLNPKNSKYTGGSSQSFNPSLNNLTSSQLSSFPSLTSHLRANPFNRPPSPTGTPNSTMSSNKNTFDSFFESNPFWLNPENVEQYRGELYGKIAHNVAGAAAASKNLSNASGSGSSSGSPHSSTSSNSLPLPRGFRPAFFSNSSSPPRLFTPLKEPRSLSDLPSDLLSYQSPASFAQEQTQSENINAIVAGLAAQTLLERMTVAFLDAFTGDEKKMDGEKVAGVISGKSVVRVVPSSSSSSSSLSSLVSMTTGNSSGVDGLGLELGGLDINSSSNVSTPSSSPVGSFQEGVIARWLSIKKE